MGCRGRGEFSESIPVMRCFLATGLTGYVPPNERERRKWWSSPTPQKARLYTEPGWDEPALCHRFPERRSYLPAFRGVHCLSLPGPWEVRGRIPPPRECGQQLCTEPLSSA